MSENSRRWPEKKNLPVHLTLGEDQKQINSHSQRKHSRIARLCQPPMDAMSPNFAEKTYVNSHKTSKFAKVFSLESFPLYNTKMHIQNNFTTCVYQMYPGLD